jgi:hypothetical protein
MEDGRRRSGAGGWGGIGTRLLLENGVAWRGGQPGGGRGGWLGGECVKREESGL